MRMLLEVTIPNEPFNTLVRKGTAGPTIQKIMEELKPEIAYFTERDGSRGGIFIVNVENPSRIPAIAEPFYVLLNADCKFRVAMSPEDLARSGLDQIAKKLS